MRYCVELDNEPTLVELEPVQAHTFNAVSKASGSDSAQLSATQTLEVLSLTETSVCATVDGKVFELFWAGNNPELYFQNQRLAASVGSPLQVLARKQSAKHSAVHQTKVEAPMPGKIIKVLVAVGDTVEAGIGVLIMEAMKMENELFAPGAGKVSRIQVKPGDTVERGALLLELE